MKKNKFKIVCPSRNNEDWAKIHINSILSQTYKNYDVLYIDDCSTDNTNALVTNMTRNISNFKIKKNNTNMKRGYNIAPINIQWFMEDDEDILVFVDGDDWLANFKVLEQLNDFYNENDSWMTYGGMVCWEGGNKTSYPFPQNTEYPKKVHINNLYRYDTWRASHLRTFKW